MSTDESRQVELLKVHGELTSYDLTVLGDEVGRMVRRGCATVAVDLHEVRQLPASAGTELVRMWSEAHMGGGRFVLVGACDAVLEQVRRLGLERIIPTYVELNQVLADRRLVRPACA